MKPRDPDIITHLNRALKNELTAVNQYFLHAKMFSDWGLERIGAVSYTHLTLPTNREV